MGIFGGYDVRAVYGKALGESEARDVGRAFASFLKGGKITVGRDNRVSSDSLRDAFVQGARECGSDVIDIGLVPTPVLFFSIVEENAAGGAMITASHSPPEYNGIKMCKGRMPLSVSELKAVECIFDSKKFVFKKEGKIERKGLSEKYLAHVLKLIPKPQKRLKVVFDSGNGMCGPLAKKILEGLGCDVSCLFLEPDGTYPNHIADPSKEENLRDLQKAVVKQKAGLGIGYDADGDRCLFVDDLGKSVRPDDSNIIFARDALKKKPGGKVVYEARSSMSLPEEVSRLGGIPVMVQAGRIAVRHGMEKEKAVFSCEITGHVCFPENYGFDDGLFTAAKMVSILSSCGGKMSELTASLPHYFTTRELHVDYERKNELVEELRAELSKDFKVNSLEGMRVDFSDAWGLVRASRNHSEITVRFEGKTRKALAKVFELLRAKLSEKGVKLPELEGIIL